LWRNLKEGENLVHIGIAGSIILKLILKKLDEVAWIGLMWFVTGKSGELV
jgi:hypothetical protein